MIHGIDHNGVTDCLFTPNEIQTERTIANGESVNLTIGHPYWTAEIRVETPTRQSKSIWRAWHAARRGSRVPLLISRSFSLKPRNGPFDDTSLEITGINFGASLIAVDGLGSHVCAIGDMISYYTAAGGYYLGEVMATATPTGGAANLTVWPPPATPHGSTARPRMNYAFGEFFLTRAQRQETADPDYFEFEARQLIRPAGGPVSPFSPIVAGASFAIAETFSL